MAKIEKQTKSNITKVIHWCVFISFLGLVATALAAEFFFSKEAIMSGIDKALTMSDLFANKDILIPPSDQLFIARILRRDTWDWHFYFGLFFGSLILVWVAIYLFRGVKSFDIIKAIMMFAAIVLTISGVYMYVRLYVNIGDDVFKVLKIIHNYSWQIFSISLFLHIANIVYLENKNKGYGYISRMVSSRESKYDK